MTLILPAGSRRAQASSGMRRLDGREDWVVRDPPRGRFETRTRVDAASSLKKMGGWYETSAVEARPWRANAYAVR
jgi:hypothetical protein